MKHNKLKLIMALMLVLMLNELQAQETIPAAGGNASGSGGSASYSVGQVTYTGTNGSVSQGVQQAYAISEVTGIEQSKGISLECSVYPNPTQDYLILKVVNYDNVKLLYQLFDINGRPLKKQKTDGEVTTIYMEDILPGAYFLRVSDNQKEVKTFKILKR
jgi:opacity protein-like surface antigen